MTFMYKEKKVLKNAYTEENLRYTVMLAISYINHFGTYPNDEQANYVPLLYSHRHVPD